MKNYTGSSIAEILEAAAEENGVSSQDLKYVITSDNKEEGTVSADVYTMEDVKEFIFDYLGDYFTGIDEDIEVAIEETYNGFIVNLNADNNAVLIGHNGKTLSAFNTVVRSAVNAAFKSRINVLIDVNHYKEDRYSKLRFLAKKLGRQVQKSHVDVEMDPMPNDERKVVHQQLNEWHNLRTESEGEGASRHVCIRYVPDADEPAENTEESEEA